MKKTFQQPAFLLLGELWRRLSSKYVIFLSVSVLTGLVSLLPPGLFLLFTERVGINSKLPLGHLPTDSFLIQLFVFGLATTVLHMLGLFFGTTLQEWMKIHIENALSFQSLNRIEEVSLRTIDSISQENRLPCSKTHFSKVSDFLTQNLPDQVKSMTVFLGSGFLFFYYSRWLASIPVATAMVIAFFKIWTQKKHQLVLGELLHFRSVLSQKLIESFEGMHTLRAFQATEYARKRFLQKSTAINKKRLKAARYLGSMMGVHEGLSQVAVTGMMILCYWAVAKNHLTIESVLIYPFYITLFYGSAQKLVVGFLGWESFLIEGERLIGVLPLQKDSTKKTHPLEAVFCEVSQSEEI